MEAAAEQSTVTLRCVDLAQFTVPASLPGARSEAIAKAAAAAAGGVVELPREVSGEGLATLVAYWAGRAAAADVEEYDGEFVRGLSHDAAVELTFAAHRLDKGLFNLL